ncbi:unnamed protein product, partial [Gulo gulo]
MIPPAPEIRCATHFLACEVPGDMTQKGELVLTAPPGGQREPALRDSFTAHLRRGPHRSRPGWHPKPSAGHPNSAGPRSGVASVGSSRPPRAGRLRSGVSARAGHRAATSPTLFTSRGQKLERDRQRSARD